MTFSEHQFTSEDGLSLYYRCYGLGDDVALCLPGLTRNSNDFQDLAEHLAQLDEARLLHHPARIDPDPQLPALEGRAIRPATHGPGCKPRLLPL
jgi:hypothetical protein